MGLLAESKSRRRINQDPNNTKWTRDETTFGQKILRSQGWEPGQYLGVQNAPHSELHTAASASYIRVSLKDDMKGLGFDKAKENEVTGLDAFNDLLSRLNGKSEAAVEEDKQARMVVKMNRYVEQKFGPMRFVRGGLLVGDELKEEEGCKESSTDTRALDESTDSKAEKDTSKESKKRKASSQEEDNDEESAGKDSESKSSKKRRKEEKRVKKRSAETSNEENEDTKSAKKQKSKKDKSREQSAVSSDDSEPSDASTKRKSKSKSTSSDEGDDKKAKKERKEEKRARKEQKKKEKKEKKEEKKRRKREAESSSEAEEESSRSTPKSTPATSGTSTPNPHLVRSRFLKAKREAMMNDNSINKIFMLKT